MTRYKRLSLLNTCTSGECQMDLSPLCSLTSSARSFRRSWTDLSCEQWRHAAHSPGVPEISQLKSQISATLFKLSDHQIVKFTFPV